MPGTRARKVPQLFKVEGDKVEGDKVEGDKAEGDKAEGDKVERDKAAEKQGGVNAVSCFEVSKLPQQDVINAHLVKTCT
jgi:hypothetical protein